MSRSTHTHTHIYIYIYYIEIVQPFYPELILLTGVTSAILSAKRALQKERAKRQNHEFY